MKAAKKVGAIALFIVSGVFAVVGTLPLLDDAKEFLPLSCFLLALAVLFFLLGRKAWRKPGEAPAKGKAAHTPIVEAKPIQSKTSSLSIEDALLLSGTLKSINWLNRQSVEAAHKMLSPSERIIYAIYVDIYKHPILGNLNVSMKGLLKEMNNFEKGVVIISDKRVFCCANRKTKQIALKNIQSVDDDIIVLRISGMTEMIILQMSVDTIATFKQKLEEATSVSNDAAINTAAAHTISVSDSATELKHYAELLKDGIITQGEFEAKKKQLL